jgi:serine/threonine protein kinase
MGLVHCDFKSENILISFDFQKEIVSSVKLIDFGTSFGFNQVNSEVQVTTPEYLPPEILEFIDYRMMNMVGYNEQVNAQLNIQKKLWQWSIDVWSLGVIVLETVIGFPVWMSYKGRIVKGNRSSLNLMTGTFGVQGRVPSKIAKIQQNVS